MLIKKTYFVNINTRILRCALGWHGGKSLHAFGRLGVL